MATISDKELTEALFNYTVKVMRYSNPYATKETISRRVLQECAEILNVDLNCWTSKNIMYIHLDNMSKIDSKWQNLIERGTKILHDELNTYKLLKSSDFVNILDVQKFIHIMSNKNENKFLLELLAVDGFQGIADNKSYVENLKIGDKGTDHIQVVREIYNKFDVSVKVVYFALLEIYEYFTTDHEVQQLVTNIKEDLAKDIDQSQVNSIMEMYKSTVNDLKSIALTKLAQLKNLKKKTKTTKRKVKIALKENKKSKSSQEEVE